MCGKISIGWSIYTQIHLSLSISLGQQVKHIYNLVYKWNWICTWMGYICDPPFILMKVGPERGRQSLMCKVCENHLDIYFEPWGCAQRSDKMRISDNMGAMCVCVFCFCSATARMIFDRDFLRCRKYNVPFRRGPDERAPSYRRRSTFPPRDRRYANRNVRLRIRQDFDLCVVGEKRGS